MCNLKKKQHTQTDTKNKQRYIYREQTGGCLEGRRVGRKEIAEGGYQVQKFQLQNKPVMDMKCTAWGI